MFGTKLSKKDCEGLLDELKWCQAPFQCAHGRPSLAPLLQLDKLELKSNVSKKLNFAKLNDVLTF